MYRLVEAGFRLVAVGRRPQSDLYQQQSQTSLDQQFLISATNKLNIDQILLLQRLRINPAENYQFTDVAIDENPLGEEYTNEQSLIEKALAQRADLKSSQRYQDAALLAFHMPGQPSVPALNLGAKMRAVGSGPVVTAGRFPRRRRGFKP